MVVLIYAIQLFANVLTGLLVIRAILSWFVNPYTSNGYSALYKINMIIIRVTEPIVVPFRQLLSRYNTGMFDFSVILAFFAINIISRILIKILLMFTF